jgi:hypothetical protein
MICRIASLLRLPSLLALALVGLMSVLEVTAQNAPQQVPTFDPSEVYFQGYLSVRDAEKLEQANDFVGADDRLQRARKMLQSIQTYYPDWKADMVKGRMEKTEETIARIKPKADEIRFKKDKAIAEIEGGQKVAGRLIPPGQGLQPLNPRGVEPPNAQDNQRLQRAENEVRRLQQQVEGAGASAGEDPSNSSQFDKMRAQRDILQTQLKMAQTDLAALRAQLAASPVNDELKSLNQKIEALQLEREGMGTALNQSRAEQLQAMSKIATLQADVKALLQNKADLERDLSLQTKTAGEVVAGLRAQMKDLEGALKKKDVELAAANGRIAGLMKELDESKAAYGQLQNEHNELLQERDQMKALLKLNEAGRIQELIEQNVDLAKKLREAGERVDRLNADGNATKDMLAEALRDFAIAKSQINRLQAEKRNQDQRIADLEKRLKEEEAGLASGGGDSAEANMLREIIKKQLLVQERRRQAKDELVKAIQQLGSKDAVVQQAIKQLDGQDLELSPEEQKLIAGNADADLVSPYARDRKTVEGAMGGLSRELEGYDMAAKKAFSSGRLLPARELYELSVEANPGDQSSLCKLGVVQLRLEDWMSATESFRRATEIDANNPYAHRMLGYAQLKISDIVGAEQSLKTAVDLSPDDASAHLLLGKVYYRQGRLPEAESAFRASVAADPSKNEPYFNLAVLCARTNKLKEGLKLYQQALDLGALPDPALEKKLIAESGEEKEKPKEKTPEPASEMPAGSTPRPENPPAARKGAP